MSPPRCIGIAIGIKAWIGIGIDLRPDSASFPSAGCASDDRPGREPGFPLPEGQSPSGAAESVESLSILEGDDTDQSQADFSWVPMSTSAISDPLAEAKSKNRVHAPQRENVSFQCAGGASNGRLQVQGLIPITMESGPTRCSTRQSVKPASL